MKHKRPPIPVIVIVILAILVGAYFGIRALLDKGNGALTASGTIEAVDITISPELGGKVVEVNVDEGDAVSTGDVLFRLDDATYQAQRAVAVASLNLATAASSTADAAQATAQANFFPVLDAARAESAATRTPDWRGINPAGYTLPGGYFSQLDQMAAAQAEVDNAQVARDLTQDSLRTLLVESASAEFTTAETRLLNARAALIVAQDVLTRASLSNNTDLQNTAQTAYDDAKTELEDAQSTYDSLKNTEAAKSIIIVRADLAVAQERYEAAQDRLLTLQTGENSPKVAVVRAALQQAIFAADQAYLAVAQAEASLALIDVQIGKLTVTAPADGVILTRNIEPGEVIASSVAVMTLGRLDSLTITVYIPEDRYGELSLGQSATVSVDSFPGETFTASVIHIADQAEFTPRNVQTVEGRKSTVFAIKLQVQEPDGKLKPGMPADVTFDDKGKGK
jgi:multidrug resistance efflux pump